MKLKLFATLLLSMLCLAPALAKKKPDVKCVLTLNDGKKVEGWYMKASYGTYGPENVKNMDEITITPTKGGKDGTTYHANDVKKLVCTNEETGDVKEYWSLYAIKALTHPENMKPSGHKYFWLVVYQGKYVTGFLSVSSWTYGTMGRETSTPCSYCIDGDNIAVTFFVPTNAITIGLRANLKYRFKRFPKMVDYLDSKELKLKEIKKDPFVLLEQLDRILSNEQL
ncbi:hypothetical protein [Hoylesella marshii]|uniref:hypothetical protein n=1 Tax=Hoylesella marshii TaxID=189722 RepID=UPI0028D4192B|nr:hypothetical protein [Hoylesella marshii]